MAGESRMTVTLALLANVAVATTKTVAGVIGGSSAVLSESAHSVADSVNEMFLVASVRRSERPPDDRHPFGYGAERFFWSLIAAVCIFVTGGGFSLFQAYRAFSSPPRAGRWLLEFIALGIAAIFEGASLSRALWQIRKEASSVGRDSIEHIVKSADPAVKTVVLEDSIAVFGIAVATAGVALHWATGNGKWEGLASAVIGALLIFSAFALARDNMSLLIGESVDRATEEGIRSVVASHPMVEAIVELLTMYLGAHEIMVAARVVLADGLTSEQVAHMSSEIDSLLLSSNSEVTQVFIDVTTSEERLRFEADQQGVGAA